MNIEKFPGAELILEGLKDVAADRITPSACAIAIALPRLSKVGLVDRALLAKQIPEPERTLYRLLDEQGEGAYARYNAFLRRLIRFEHALDRATAY